jgi:hypothetical protein
MVEKLVEQYQKGALTADHLVLQCLDMVDPRHPEHVLKALPPTILERMLKYAREYRPEGMRTNYGPQPAAEQVEAAKEWIESHAHAFRLAV